MKNHLSTLIVSALLILAPHTSFAALWKVDHSASKIGIIAKFNNSPVEGQFENFTTSIDFDPDRPELAKITVGIDLTAAKMKDPQQTAALVSKDWFNTAQFPDATLTSTNVKSTGTGTFVMSALLTLKGKTHPITLPFSLTTKNNKAHATGEFIIMRNDFSVGTGPFSSGSFVGFEVKLKIDITAVRID